ncbi:MAG: hypothetical protein IJT88_01085 [Kiritimatiellae bacterium]|nr:hypothetical protein [Kiritimatiellia bacterium]
MRDEDRLTLAAIDDAVARAREQSETLIEKLLREAIADFEAADSDGFKLALTIEGARAGRHATLTLQTKGQTCVELKRKYSTEANVIDWGPRLFDPDGDFTEAEEVEVVEERKLLPPAPKLLPAPEEEDAQDGKDAKDGKAGVGKVRKITISNTGISDLALKDNPEWYRKLTTMRKTGAAEVGEVVRIIIRNPDDGHKFDMGLYKCTDAAPAYDDPADWRSVYTFIRLEDEDGPVNGGGDIPGDE